MGSKSKCGDCNFYKNGTCDMNSCCRTLSDFEVQDLIDNDNVSYMSPVDSECYIVSDAKSSIVESFYKAYVRIVEDNEPLPF